MKTNIHPNYHSVNVTCSCGNAFAVFSTYKDDTLSVEICAACHPFYTGQQKVLENVGQVDKFRRRYGGKK